MTLFQSEKVIISEGICIDLQKRIPYVHTSNWSFVHKHTGNVFGGMQGSFFAIVGL